MDEGRFLALMKEARTHSYVGVNADYWHGYQRGLRRGFLGELFGTDGEHMLWMRLADDGADKASRERGRGYRDGLSACGVAADEGRFLALMKEARTHSYVGVNADYWHGYQRGLRRGFLGELFGTDGEHMLWMRLADEGPDKASRERGRGYRDGLSACGVAVDEGSPIAGSTPARTGDLERRATRGYPNRG